MSSSISEAGLPKYEEAVNLHLHDISLGHEFDNIHVPISYSNYDHDPSAPINLDAHGYGNNELPDSLEDSLEGMEDSILLEKQPGEKDYGPYSYNIRNCGNQALLFQGNVDYKYSANILNLMGRQMLKIHPTGTREVDEYDSIQSFQFAYGNLILGTSEFRQIENKICQCSLTNPIEHITYRINIIGDQAVDIIIAREKAGTLSPIAKINVPVQLAGDNFNCKIVFQNPPGHDSRVTNIEKYLVMALTVTFLIVRNGKIRTPEEASAAKCTGYCLGIIVLGVIIAIFFLFILYLSSKECEWKPYKAKCKN